MLKFPRRKFLHLAAGAAALPALSRVARAQAYPARPVRIIVGFAAGGATDILARLLGQVLSERLGQQFVIETARALPLISPNKLKRAKQLSGIASASTKSSFMAKCVCLWLRLPNRILARLDVRTTLSKKFNGRNGSPCSSQTGGRGGRKLGRRRRSCSAHFEG